MSSKINTVVHCKTCKISVISTLLRARSVKIRNDITRNNGEITSIEGKLSQEQSNLNNSNLRDDEKRIIDQRIHDLKQQKQDYIIANETLEREITQIQNQSARENKENNY
ncbi:unnamed protein product [Rotaria magnacalcarata]